MTPPVAELHVHIEGTLEPELIFELAERNSVKLPYANVEDLRSRYEFTDLQSFLNLYYDNMTVLRTERDFADLTNAYLHRAVAAGVRHAEIFIDPQAHTMRGVALGTAIRGVAGALATSERDFGISTGLIVCFLRDQPPADAMATLEAVLALDDVAILGIGLDSAEVGYPPSAFADVFDRAHAEGLRCVAHAGEEGPPAYVWEALDILKVARIDHGIRSMEDEVLVDRLVRERIPLTVCPLSNVRLRAVPDLSSHPVVAMLRRGLLVTINADDPAYFGGYVDENFRQLTDEFALSRDDLAVLARNSIHASFLGAGAKEALLAEIDAWRDLAG